VLMRRLRARGWGHVLFHGGVPGDKRGALVDRFVQDPACRLFLSTDAGGVGLNLQHAAATVVNMDLPWNPAKLEQRIGRVHRMGQRRGVQVINFVAQGSIEEGMLGVLAFKQSLFAGVLDGGDSEVFMNGTRLSKFMESVDAVTGAMGTAEDAAAAPSARSAAQAPAAGPEGVPSRFATPLQGAAADQDTGVAPLTGEPIDEPIDEPVGEPIGEPIGELIGEPAAEAEPVTPSAPADPWAPLLEAGLQWIAALTATPASAAGAGVNANGTGTGTETGNGQWQGQGQGQGAPRVTTDPATGERRLSLPLPDPATVRRLADSLVGLLARLQRPG